MDHGERRGGAGSAAPPQQECSVAGAPGHSRISAQAPGLRRPPLKTKFERWRFWLPYGCWTCADGREVLFNRRYVPIYERRPGEPARVADHDEWVPWTEQRWLFTDRDAPWVSPPWERATTLKRIDAVLIAWGLLPPLPMPPPRRRRR